jgi:apolipoprotein N-acyltransferase
MYLYGGLIKPISFGILLLFALYLGLYHALFALLIALLRKTYSVSLTLVLAPIAWISVELARARITGFPWDLLGYTQIDNLFLTKLAPFTGVMGLSLLVAAVNALWAAIFLLRTKRSIGIVGATAATATLLFVLIGIHLRPALTPPHQIATLLQENLSVGEESRGSRESKDEMFAAFSKLSEHPPVIAQSEDLPATSKLSTPPTGLIVWPEAPTLFADSDPRFRESLGAVAKATDAPVISDSVSVGDRNEMGRYNEYNSASFFRPDGSYAGRYDKMHLVPFGEYTPYKSLFFFAGHLLDDLPFVPGTQRRIFDVNGKRYGVFICYESIFGDEVRHFVLDGAQVLVNISDDGWYGDTSAPWEHMNMARMRAIENGRWVLRSTNTGITAAIDPQGVVRAQLPRHIRSAIDVGFDFENQLTFYTRHGDWVAWLCSGVLVVAIISGVWRRLRLHREAATQ